MSDETQLRGLRQLLNSRQAPRVLDVSDQAAIHCDWESGRDIYVRGTDAGLYMVGYGSGGGLYMSRVVEIGTVSAVVAGAERYDDATVRVTSDYRAPAVRQPPARVRNGGSA